MLFQNQLCQDWKINIAWGVIPSVLRDKKKKKKTINLWDVIFELLYSSGYLFSRSSSKFCEFGIEDNLFSNEIVLLAGGSDAS